MKATSNKAMTTKQKGLGSFIYKLLESEIKRLYKTNEQNTAKKGFLKQ